MGYSSELWIEQHNAQMEDADYAANYAEDYFREMAIYEAEFYEENLSLEKFTDFFDEYRIDFKGYEEFDVFEDDDDDLPF